MPGPILSIVSFCVIICILPNHVMFDILNATKTVVRLCMPDSRNMGEVLITRSDRNF